MGTWVGALTDGTVVTVDGPLDPSLPVVVLLHGMGGSSVDMTAPAAAYPGLSFNRSGLPALYKDEGLNFGPPVLPVARFYLDPPAGPLTSWNAALKIAGFTTITYSQAGLLIANDVTQLTLLVRQVLMAGALPWVPPSLSSLRVAIVAHSRGGLVARSFLGGAGANPSLAGFLPRFTSLITLHSPNTGSGVATVAATVAALLGRVATAFTAGGLPGGAAFATALSGLVLNRARAELVPGSATLTAIAAAEPVAGVTYHTFGGISTDFARLWADVYTPDSTLPFFLPFVPFPVFHWGSAPAIVGVPLNVASFVPAVLASPAPFVTELVTTLAALAATTPDIAPGAGDLLVSDARARLPFATSHTTNVLNHLEALSDPTLQAQVVALLLRLRVPVSAGWASGIRGVPVWNNGKAYFFRGSQYLRYDVVNDRVDLGYPQPIAGNWPKLWADGIDAAVTWNNGKVYFFRGSQYIRYDLATQQPDANYPQPIEGNWPKLWADGIDAAVLWNNSTAYFFKGNSYVRYDVAADTVLPGYPQKIAGNWPGLTFTDGIDAAVMWNNGKAYFFRGTQYIRYDPVADRADDGYPAPILGNWHGF